MADFLLEIGLEEIPARMIAGAEAELGRRVGELLTRERLLGAGGKVTTYSTPRRLAVRVEGLALAQPDTEEQLVGPSWKVAFPNGEAGPAAVAFAKKAEVEVSALTKITTVKGEYVSATVERKGRTAAELLAAELPKEVLSIYWAKNMYWRAGKPERFVRPVRWLVALLDSAVVPLEIAGIAAGNQSRGHRILHGDSPVAIGAPGDYPEALRRAFVEADVAARRHKIRKTLDHVTRAITETPGARWREDEALVDTVVHLTEWPTVLYGSFEAEYLALPEEVLVTVMRDHQKYFAVEDVQGKLAPHFLTVLNTQVDDEGRAIIRHGNERVLRSRFKDAQFFWETDQKIRLEDRLELLESVTFQKELGSYAWKTAKNVEVAQVLAARLKANGVVEFDETALLSAVQLAKVDLTAELVKEFTELQGVIGGLYARAQDLGETVAEAIYSQYAPASTDDGIPSTIEGQLLGLADRMHTIVAMFGIGNAPTGSKDPFALRRAANAVVKILAESLLPLTLTNVISSVQGTEEALLHVKAFLEERLSFYLKDVYGYAYDVVNAVLAANADDVQDAVMRAQALTVVRGSEDFLAISAAFKRMKNILHQASEKGEKIPKHGVQVSLLVQPEEYQLFTVSGDLAAEVDNLREDGNYVGAFEVIATLRPVVDAFFDKVMVMAPEPELRAARLALIQSVLDGFSGIADFSEIVVG
ncbi:glycine--tRNA ligase subunit beta [Acidicapsa acidisoli]|uniref:glycine--tRNA ligase subunit beta n=1 Tax=Acidicapsa acidisoli TaxID=1615681 RepID=UPI0021E060AD|nr:glycine--tRNA ligase subunit beta [Acidicapsa acidisoli]